MPRFLIALLFIAVTVFAVSDWVVRSRVSTPGHINRWVWLAVIVLIPLIGPLAWIISGLVTRAEEHSGQRSPAPTVPELPPDDNPDAISDVADRLARRKKRTRERPPNAEGAKDRGSSESERPKGTALPPEAGETRQSDASIPDRDDTEDHPSSGDWGPVN